MAGDLAQEFGRLEGQRSSMGTELKSRSASMHDASVGFVVNGDATAASTRLACPVNHGEHQIAPVGELALPQVGRRLPGDDIRPPIAERRRMEPLR